MNKKDIRKISLGRPSAAGGEGDCRVHWGHEDVLNLVGKVRDHWHEFSNGVRKKKFIWTDIAAELGREGFYATGVDCDRKWRNLKIRYLAVLEKQVTGEKTGHRIDYYDSIHAFLKDDEDTLTHLELRRKQQHDPKEQVKRNEGEEEDLSDMSADGVMEWTDISVQLLLDLLLEFRDGFSDKDSDHDASTTWEAISEQMKLEGHKPGPEQCQRKWSTLVTAFQHQKAEAEANASVPLWPYYTRVRHLITHIGIPDTSVENSNPLKRRSKGTRPSPKKSQRIFKQEVEDTDDNLLDEAQDEDILPESSSAEPTVSNTRSRVQGGSSLLPTEIREVCARLDRVEENLAVCRRLDQLEARLDDAAQQQQAQYQTNSLLTQVLSELSRLSQALATRCHTHSSRADPSDLSSGITIVVPHSQQM